MIAQVYVMVMLKRMFVEHVMDLQQIHLNVYKSDLCLLLVILI